MRIPNWPIATARERELLEEVLNSIAWGGSHPIVEQFEQEFAEFQHARFGVSCTNGTMALELALEAAGVGTGHEVIVPAISFVATASAVNRVGATPVFVDIEADTFNIDPVRVRAAITARTRAIIAVHFGGPLADMDHLADIAEDHGLILIEDAAHAHGSEWKGRRAGSLGLAGCFSFQSSKVMTAGEGGIVITDDEELAAAVRSLANQGRRPGRGWFEHHRIASNYRLSGLQAAVLKAQLERLPEQIAQRSRNAERIEELTAKVPGLHWQRRGKETTASSWYLLLGRIDIDGEGMDRNRFCAELQERQVPCTPFYPHTLYQNPMYVRGGCRVTPCPVAEASIRDSFWLPHRVLMGDDETTDAVAQSIVQAAQAACLSQQ